MSRSVNNPNVQPLKSDNTIPAAAAAGPTYYQPLTADNSIAPAATAGYTLTSATTYYYELTGPHTVNATAWTDPQGDDSQPLHSLQIILDSAIVITSIEIEDTNLPGAQTTSAVAGEWIKENPSGASVATIGNATATVLVIAKTAGAIGGAMIHLGNTGALRMRAKVVVGATGGVARLAFTGKG